MKEQYKCDCTRYSCADLENGDVQQLDKETGMVDFIPGDVDTCEVRRLSDNNFRYFLRPLNVPDDPMVLDVILRK